MLLEVKNDLGKASRCIRGTGIKLRPGIKLDLRPAKFKTEIQNVILYCTNLHIYNDKY